MQKEKFEIRNMLFLEEDRQKVIEVEGGDVFIIKAIFPRERLEIARAMSVKRNGLPANSFSFDDNYFVERSVLIDSAIVEAPQWWSGSDNCPDDTLLDKLYGEVNDWTREFQEKLKKNKLNRRGAEAGIPG